MIPRASDIASSLTASRRTLQVAPWKFALAYSCFVVIWILSTDVVIHTWGLPSWTYSARGLFTGGFTVVCMWVFTRRLAEGAIRTQSLISEAEGGYRALFEVHPAPMWLYDKRSLMILKANEAAVTTYGYAPEDFAGLSILDLYAPAEREYILQRSSNQEINSSALSGIRKHVRHDQRVMAMDVLGNEGLFKGQPYGLLMARDVSAHFEMERKLAHSLGVIELAQQIAMMGYWEQDPITLHMTWSQEIYSILGIEGATLQLDMARFLSAVHPDDRIRVDTAHQDIARTGHMTLEYRIVRPQGEIRYIYERATITREPSGGAQILLGTYIDITELKAAEHRLAEQQKRYEHMISRLPEGVLIVRKGAIHYANAAACDMFGGSVKLSLEEVDLSQCIHPEFRAREIDRLSALKKGLINEQSFRYLKLLRLDGSEFEAEVAEIVLEDKGQRDIQLIVRDVSQAQQMRRALEDANSRLQHLSQRLIEVQEAERRQLARDLHDDVGQQLTGLKLHLQRLIKKLDLEPSLKEMAQTIAHSVDEALSKVRSLSLSLHPLQLENLGLEAAVRWHLAHFLEATQTKWELQVVGPVSETSPEKAVAAFRIVQEAIANVARHAQADTVRISLKRDAEGLKLEILDDGQGFDVDEAIQGAKSLGLTSMHERVASLGGEVKISSLKGVGTRISVRLPAVQAPLK